jgi:CheY-like chemotaxis protein
MSDTTILIVEDEGLIALHIMEILSRAGYRFPDPVSSGEEALELLERSLHPDLILMDIGLAGKIDGIETTRRIKKRFDIPVIFLTAYSNQNRIAEAEEVSPDGYLIKPFMEKDLLCALGKVLNGRAGG